MNAIKSLIAVSALGTVASTANATLWNITLSTTNSDVGGSPISMNLSGTYDDTAVVYSPYFGNVPGVGSMGGQVDFADNINTYYQPQTFVMNPTTGKGYINQIVNGSFTCQGPAIDCFYIQAGFNGYWYNDINFSYGTGAFGQYDISTGTPFIPTADGVFTWTFVLGITGPESQSKLYQIPFTVTLTPAVPLPSTAWLFGSGLIGLARVSRRRNRKS